jgi:hypothetical protein
VDYSESAQKRKRVVGKSLWFLTAVAQLTLDAIETQLLNRIGLGALVVAIG